MALESIHAFLKMSYAEEMSWDLIKKRINEIIRQRQEHTHCCSSIPYEANVISPKTPNQFLRLSAKTYYLHVKSEQYKEVYKQNNPVCGRNVASGD